MSNASIFTRMRRIIRRPRELALFFEALWMLFRTHILSKIGYAALRREMKAGIALDVNAPDEETIAAVVVAVKRACRYYPESAACLQRSVALASMLRKRGIAADVQIGVRQSPFGSHAWVEVHGRVLNDVPDVRETYPSLHQFKPGRENLRELTRL